MQVQEKQGMNRVDIALKYQVQFDGLMRNKTMALEIELKNDKKSAAGASEAKKKLAEKNR